MSNDQKYSCTNELGAEILVIITSMFVTMTILFHVVVDTTKTFFGIASSMLGMVYTNNNYIIDVDLGDENTNVFLSLAYALLLPLMSYLFSQAKQYYPEGRAQVILIWMVFIEIIRIGGDPIFAWSLRKSAEQLVRLFWVSFLIFSFTSLSGIKASLLILCALFAISVVWKGILFNKAKSSHLLGNNPKLIHNYLKRTSLKDDLQTTPLNKCCYIVFGEENHEISILGKGYLLCNKKPDSSNGVLTIGRVFQLESEEDEAFTVAYPNWRDTCLSFALAKILRCRFANLSLEETDSTKALSFVLEELIDYIGNNHDIQTDESSDESSEKRNVERVFCIIQKELNFVSDFLQMRIPITQFFTAYRFYDSSVINIVFAIGVYLICTIWKRISSWLSFVAQDANMSCFFQTVRTYHMLKTLSHLDQAITILLFIACVYTYYVGLSSSHLVNWYELKTVQNYISDPAKWYKSSSLKILFGAMTSSLKQSIMTTKKVDEFQVHPTVFDMRREKIFFFVKINWSIILYLPKWIRRRIPRATTAIRHSTNAKEAILMSLRKSKGQLTSGETSISKHRIEHLNWACRLHEGTTEVILVWHIATTLFHHSHPNKTENSTNQGNSAPQSDNPSIALELSSYCHYLVAYHPDLLPDEVEYTKSKYEAVRKDILDIDKFCDQNPTKKYRCSYVLQARWNKTSVIEKGANLANDMIKCAENGVQVWEMLADFWAEMLLFIAPSDNVEAHQKLLDREELITQLWALLTHAGILSRPEPTEDHHQESGDNNIETTTTEEIV